MEFQFVKKPLYQTSMVWLAYTWMILKVKENYNVREGVLKELVVGPTSFALLPPSSTLEDHTWEGTHPTIWVWAEEKGKIIFFKGI